MKFLAKSNIQAFFSYSLKLVFLVLKSKVHGFLGGRIIITKFWAEAWYSRLFKTQGRTYEICNPWINMHDIFGPMKNIHFWTGY